MVEVDGTNKTIEISLNKPHMDKFAVNFFIYTYIFLVPYVMLILAALTLCVLFVSIKLLLRHGYRK